MKNGPIKRRWLIFVALLFITLIVVYLQPIFFPRQVQTLRPHDSQVVGEGGNTSLQVEPIQAEGFAKLIGKSQKEFERTYGSPIVSYDSGYGFWINRYQTELTNSYLEVSIQEGKIAAIKTAGIDGTDIAPFQLKMSMGDLAQITMLYPNFTVKNGEEDVSLELMEEDLNYRPLVAFDNGTYGILFFNNDSELIAVAYLTAQMLLKLAPYSVTDGTVTAIQPTEENWEAIDQQKETQGFRLLNILRTNENLPNYDTTYTLQGQSRDFLARFLKKPESYLDGTKLESFLRVTEDAGNEFFIIGGKEFEELAAALEVPGVYGFFETPCYDLTFQILSWYSDPYIHTRFTKESPQATAIGISQQNMVILFEDRTSTEDSE